MIQYCEVKQVLLGMDQYDLLNVLIVYSLLAAEDVPLNNVKAQLHLLLEFWSLNFSTV